MDPNARNALLFVGLAIPIMLAARIVIQSRRGTLQLDREFGYVLFGIAAFGLASLLYASRFGALLGVPIVLISLGLVLAVQAHDARARPGLRTLGILAAISGFGWLLIGLVRLASEQ